MWGGEMNASRSPNRVGGRLGVSLSLLLLFVISIANDAMANMTITAPSIDMATMGSYATVILTALAGVWLVRKFIKTTNRS